jgi:hypothetical protein
MNPGRDGISAASTTIHTTREGVFCVVVCASFALALALPFLFLGSLAACVPPV